MKVELKQYKLIKIERYFKNKKFFLFFTSLNKETSNATKTPKVSTKNNLRFFKMVNGISKLFFKNSIFKNINLIFTGSTVLVDISKSTSGIDNLRIIKNLDSEMFLLGARLNNNLYSSSQLSCLHSCEYNKNIRLLHGSLKKKLMYSYTKLLLKKSK